MPKTKCETLYAKQKPAKNQMLKKCKHDLSSISRHRKSWNMKKNEGDK